MKNNSFVTAAWAMGASVLLLAGVLSADDAPATQPASPATRPADAGGPRREPGVYLNRLHEIVNGLDLTADQKPKVDALFAKASEDLKAAIASAREQGVDRREVGQKIRSIMDSIREGLKGILNADQVKTLQSKLPGNGPAVGGGPGQLLQRLTSALEKLNLSDDQKKQVEDVLKSTRDQFEKIRAEAANGTGDARDKIRATVEDTRQKLENILTPDQKEKLQQLREEREKQGGTAK